MTISIQNRLRIYEGNILLLPGCEPISVVTNISNYQYNPDVTTLYNNYDKICKASYIKLDKAREVIPEAKIIWNHSPSARYFVLPDGPPPDNNCPHQNCVEDWYKLLRDNADGTVEVLSGEECSAFSYNWCCQEQKHI